MLVIKFGWKPGVANGTLATVPLNSAKSTRIVLNEQTEFLLSSQIWQQNYKDKIVQNDWN